MRLSNRINVYEQYAQEYKRYLQEFVSDVSWYPIMILTGATIPKITFKRRSATLECELLGQYIAKGAPKRTRKYIVPS